MSDRPATQEMQQLKWWSNPRVLLRYVLSLNDTPHAIALGTAIGMFIGLTPTVGVQMLIAIGVYYLCLPFFRFNAKAAIVTVYISNPLTMLPLYWFDYRVGQFFFGGDVTRDQLSHILTYESFSGWWHTILTLFVDLGWTMLAGSFIVGAVGAAITYPVMRYLLQLWHQNSRNDQNELKQPSADSHSAISRKTA